MAQKQEHHLVKWEIDIYADSPEEAAREALKIMRDKESEAVAFDVYHTKSNSFYPIDLIGEVYTNSNKIEYIKKIINEWGSFSTAEVEADCSPCINTIGDAHVLVEEMHAETVTANSYVNNCHIIENYIKYEDLESDVIDDIVRMVEDWEAENIQTEKRIS